MNWQKYPWLRVVGGAAIAFFAIALTLTLHRHYSFYSSYDQGIFNQVFWNGLHGRFFQSSLSSQLSTNVVHGGELPDVSYYRLGQHFTPALLLWLPLYALFPYPATLTVLQVILVTTAGLVLYVLARQHLEPPVSAMITVSFYGANAIIGPTLSNFHDICQLPLFIFGLLLAMEKRWWWLFWVLAVLILMVREDSGVGLFGVGVYLILSQRYPRTGLAVCTLSFGYMLVLTNLIMPLFSQDISQRFMMERFGQYATGEKATTLEIIWGMVSNPWRLLVELVTPLDRTIKYLLGQWLPFAFIPAVAPPAWAIAGFPMLKLFLGKGQSVLAINIRYAMTVVPGLCFGAILWWSNRQALLRAPLREVVAEVLQSGRSFLLRPVVDPALIWWEKHPRLLKVSVQRFWTICICFSLLFTVTSNPNYTLYFLIPDSIQPLVYVPLTRQWQHSYQIRSLLAEIPPDASVAATTHIIPHLSGRREIIRFPGVQLRNDAGEVMNVEYAIADLWHLQRYQPAFKAEREMLQDCDRAIELITREGQYGIIGFKDGVILMRNGATSDSEATAAWQVFRQQIPPSA